MYVLLSLLGEKGHTLLSTESTVLFCGLILKPGESKNGDCYYVLTPHPPLMLPHLPQCCIASRYQEGDPLRGADDWSSTATSWRLVHRDQGHRPRYSGFLSEWWSFPVSAHAEYFNMEGELQWNLFIAETRVFAIMHTCTFVGAWLSFWVWHTLFILKTWMPGLYIWGALLFLTTSSWICNSVI